MFNPRPLGGKSPPKAVPCKGTTIRRKSAYMPMTWRVLSKKIFHNRSLMNLDNVILWTCNFRAIDDLENPAARQFRIISSLPVNFVWELFRPLGRPNTIPSDRFRAKASFVRCEIRFRSISAERPKAKARTLELMSEQRR